MCFQTLNTRNHDTLSKLKRGHYTADKTLTSLQRHFLNGKNGSAEPQLFEEILFFSKIKLEPFRSTKCCKFKNAWICDDYAATEKNASPQICPLFYFLSSLKKRQSNATEKLLIGWSCDRFHSTVFFHSFSWSIIIQHKPHSFIVRFKYQ